MKKYFKINLAALIIFCSISTALAQDNSDLNKSNEETKVAKNELRLNALYLLLGAIEVNYEYLLDEDSGVGVTAMYTYDSDFWEYKQQISGYYRQYFGKKRAGGFYGEAFLMYNVIENDYYYYYSESYEAKADDSQNLGVGFAFGTKLISKSNLLLDLGLGLGRNIISSEEDNWLVPRFNVSFGYRF